MSTLYEALQSLQSMGILEIRHGDGSYVTDRPEMIIDRKFSLSFLLSNLDVRDLFEVRTFLEGGLIYYASEHASEEQLSALFTNLDEKERAIEVGSQCAMIDLDVEFHCIISNMAKSESLEHIANSLYPELEF